MQLILVIYLSCKEGNGAICNATRGIIGGDNVCWWNQDDIEYVTIASEGNAVDFGNLTCTDGAG